MPVPVFAPDGTVRQIPDDQVQAALSAGGKRAVRMVDPQGTQRWIPEDKQQDALQAGGKLVGEQKGFGESFAGTSGLSALKDVVTGFTPKLAYDYGRGLVNEGKRVYGEAQQAVNAPNYTEAQRHITAAIPFVGPGLIQGGEQVDAHNYAGAAGSLAGTVAGMLGPEEVPGVIRRTAKGVSAGAEAAKNLAGTVKDAVYPESTTVTPAQASARKLGKALTVQVQAMPNFVNAATEEAGTIMDYAKKNGIRINSTLDFANAAKGAADAVQSHFDEAIMKPNADRVVSVPADYRGAKLNVEGSRATLGEINQRINAINQEMSPNYRKATAMQTNAANVSDADLLAEKRKLTSLLHDNLADATGLDPEDIAALRRKAGKLRTIADEANYSANTNTNAAGKAAMGGTDLPAATKMGILERGVQAIRGGPEVIGNRAVRRAVQDISPTELVLPNPRINPAVSPIEYPVQNQVAPSAINGTPFLSVADRLDQLLERAKANRPARKTR